MLICTSRLFAFPSRLLRGLLALPRASSKPSHLFSGVWASRYSRLYDFLHRLYWVELAISSKALPDSLFLRGEHLSEKNTISALHRTPFNCCHVVERRSLTEDCYPTTAQQLHQSQPRLPSRNTFLSRPVMYETLLLSQTAEPQSYRCLFASKLGRSDGCCALMW